MVTVDSLLQSIPPLTVYVMVSAVVGIESLGWVVVSRDSGGRVRKLV